jgi:glucose 1-dehydrogenase
MTLAGKAAIVTGGATGIGQAISIALASEGAAVVVDYVGKLAAADETLAKIHALQARAIGFEADVSDPAQVEALVGRCVSEFGRLDIFVNNAGIEFKRPFLEYSFELWQKTIAVDLAGPWLCAQAAARQMVKQGGGGRIINISSIHEDLPMPTNAAYCAAKGGLRMMTRTIAVELAPHNITVNNIGPGAIFTPIDKEIQEDAQLNAQILAGIPMARWGQPEEVAKLAVFLASDAAAYVTGSTYFIDGGMMRNAGSL